MPCEDERIRHPTPKKGDVAHLVTRKKTFHKITGSGTVKAALLYRDNIRGIIIGCWLIHTIM